MTLFKQMALAISLIIIVMLGSVMAINYQSTKKDMIQSLYETTVNNISTLTDKLAVASEESTIEIESDYDEMIDFDAQEKKPEIIDQPADIIQKNPMIISTIDAEFDSGYYKMIDFKSNNGASDYLKIDNDPVVGVPLWFIHFTAIDLESVSADVSSGWSMIGVVSVQGDTGVVYKALYKMFINLLYLFAASVTVALILLSIMLHFVLKPLYRVQHQE